MMKTRIIIADNREDICSGLRKILAKEQDMEVIAEANDTMSAVQLTPELKPDVVVIDMNLSHNNGIHSIPQIIKTMKNVKVLVVSFHSDSRFVVRMLHAGASGYLLKDCVHEELPLAIREVVSNHIYISSGIAGITNKNSEYNLGNNSDEFDIK